MNKKFASALEIIINKIIVNNLIINKNIKKGIGRIMSRDLKLFFQYVTPSMAGMLIAGVYSIVEDRKSVV